MPEISRFFGIAILMNYNDHKPPHFHSRYQEQEVTIAEDTTLNLRRRKGCKNKYLPLPLKYETSGSSNLLSYHSVFHSTSSQHSCVYIPLKLPHRVYPREIPVYKAYPLC